METSVPEEQLKDIYQVVKRLCFRTQLLFLDCFSFVPAFFFVVVVPAFFFPLVVAVQSLSPVPFFVTP